MACLALLIGGSLGRRSVRVGMRDRTHLGHEERQHSQRCDAKFEAMRPLEQGQPLSLNGNMLTPSVKTGNRPSIGDVSNFLPWLKS